MPSARSPPKMISKGPRPAISLGEEFRGVVAGGVDLAVAVLSQPQEVVILADHLPAGTREVQGDVAHVAAEVVHPENQIFRQVAGVAPEHPADAERGEAELVARGVDRLHPRQAEIPDQIRGAERGEKSAAGAIDMDRDVEAGVRLQPVEGLSDRRDRLVLAGEGDAEGGNDADGVLVATRDRLLGGHQEPPRGHRDLAKLDVPVARELVPADLHRAGDEIGAVGGFSGGLACSLPAAPHRHAAEHRRLARSGGRAADGIAAGGRVPQIGEHAHAARLDLGGLRVFVPVDHVLVDTIVHQPVNLRLLPCLAEGREVLARVAVEHQFVADSGVDMARVAFPGREPVLGHGAGEIGRGIGFLLDRFAAWMNRVQWHVRLRFVQAIRRARLASSHVRREDPRWPDPQETRPRERAVHARLRGTSIVEVRNR